ncbi:hypothetical protein [Levilactobacillus yonginensis]|uniref:hypothetical protein n=1 Tax=Levilactobacillus yonginensis TaxID=1054041 RepID=UPI00345DF485
MKDRNVIAWAIVSLIGFIAINFLMSRPFVEVAGAQMNTSEFWRSTILAVVLYAVPIVLAALNWRPSFYLMGLVIAMYTLSLVGVLLNMWSNSSAEMLIRVLMSAFAVALMVANAYWLVLALRLRKRDRDSRDRRRFSN